MSLQQIDKTFGKEDIIEQIEGYKTALLTPYGKVQSLPADLYSCGRSLKIIEQNVDRFVRPFSVSSISNNQIRDQIINTSMQSILKYLNCSPKIHTCIPFSVEKQMDAFNFICNLFLNQVKQEEEGVKVNVYLQNNQSYKNVLPWLINTDYIRIITIETDSQGNIKENSILNTVVNHIQETKYHIIQIQSTSSKTREFLNIEDIINQIEGLRNEYPQNVFYTVLDATQLIMQQEQENAFSYFDFITIQSSSLIGGQLAANILIARKEILNQFQESDLQKDMQEVDCGSLVRFTQILEFGSVYNMQEMIQQSEDNSKIFYEEMLKVNQSLQATSVLTKIHLANIKSASKTGRYSILMFIEGGEQFIDDEGKEGHGRPVLQAKLLAQYLNDFFGIQVKCNNELKTSNDFYFSDIPQQMIKQYGLTKEEGFIQLNSSTVDIDIHFLLTSDEVIYIAQALKLIAQNAVRISKYYSNNTSQLKQYIVPEYDFSLAACSQFQGNLNNFKPQKEKYQEQLQAVTKLMKNPDNFYSLQEGWSEEKSIIFPLNMSEDFLPKKPKIVQSKQQLQSKIELESAEITERRNSLMNDEQIKSARLQILKIQKDEKKVEVIEKVQVDNSKEGQIKELEFKIQQLEKSQIAKEEQIKNLTQEVRQNVEKELRHKLQIEKDYQFDLTLAQRDRRTRNLNKIYLFYCNLVDFLEERKETERIINVKLRKQKQLEPVVEKPKTLAINKFFKFCHDFELINQELDIKTLYQLFHKISTVHGEIHFNEFQIILEKMAQVFYEKSEKLFNQFDKIEQFYRHIGLDDFKLFKGKMKSEGLANFSFIFHDKYKLYNQGHVIPNNPEFILYNPRLFESSTTPITSNSNLNNLSKKDDFDWNQEKLTINPKSILNDRYVSQDEVFSEIALLSKMEDQIRNSSSLQPQSRITNKSQSYATPTIRGKQVQQYGSTNNLLQKGSPSQQTPSSPQSNQQDFSKIYNNKSSIILKNQYSTPQYNNLPRKMDQDELNFYSDSNYQADQRKQQLLHRAKQIADLEREKDNYRIKSLASESSPPNNNYIKYNQKQYEYPQQNQGQKGQKKDYISQSMVYQQNNPNEQQSINIYKNYGQSKR